MERSGNPGSVQTEVRVVHAPRRLGSSHIRDRMEAIAALRQMVETFAKVKASGGLLPKEKGRSVSAPALILYPYQTLSCQASLPPGVGAPGIGGTGCGGMSVSSSGTSTTPRPTWLLR